MTKKEHGFSLIELSIVVAIIGILAAIAVPQYQSYVVKTQIQRAIGETGALRTAIESCILSGKLTLGINEDSCSLNVTGSSILQGAPQDSSSIEPGTGVPQITPTPLNNALSIRASFGNQAISLLNGKSITWSRTAEASWHCTSDVDPKYTTTACPAP